MLKQDGPGIRARESTRTVACRICQGTGELEERREVQAELAQLTPVPEDGPEPATGLLEDF